MGPLTLASTASIFTGCAVGSASPSSVNYPNTEPEPFVAVNPTNPLNVIGVYQVDRWSDGASKAQGTAASFDGGVTWSSHAFLPFSECAGGNADYDRTTDPWDQISLPVSANLQISAVLASTSTDGGLKWNARKTLIRDETATNFNDKESITGDPTRNGYAYAVWDRGTFPSDNLSSIAQLHSFSYRGQPMFSRTTDSGNTWSTRVGLADANLDAGLSWSQPIKIDNINLITLKDPFSGNLIRAGDYIPDIAVDPSSGALYVVWADARFGDGTYLDVVMSKSTNGGRSWSSPQVVDTAPPGSSAFNGAVAVAADGTVGVLWYDLRDNTAAAGLPTDVFLRHSHDGGATFEAAQQLAGPFDMETAPVSEGRGFFLGDYQGLAASGNNLIAFFTTTIGDGGNVDSRRAIKP